MRPSTSCAAALALIAVAFAMPCRAGERRDSALVALAAAKFPSLTRAERAMLEFADKSNISRGEFAIAGTSAVPLDPNNDPAHASEWSHDRDVRAGLIRWLAIDNDASARIDPIGVRVLGARIVGPLDLSRVRVPFGVMMVRCRIQEPLNLEGTTIPFLGLDGSYTSEINGIEATIEQDLDFGSKVRDFHSSGPIVMDGAKVGGWLIMAGAHVGYSPPRLINPLVLGNQNAALSLDGVVVGHDVLLCCGFESHGTVLLSDASIGGILDLGGGQFINPNGTALWVAETTIKGTVWMSQNPYGYAGPFEADGVVNFTGAEVGNYLIVFQAKFRGKATEQHGLVAQGLRLSRRLVWQSVELANGALLDLTGADVGGLLDNSNSWPQPGKLLIDGLTYKTFGSVPPYDSPRDAPSRLRWLALQQGFHPQPYRQLAKVLAESGDDAGAMQVRIAAEDLRYAQFGAPGPLWGAFLKYTIGHGHRPLLAVFWMVGVVVIGWALITIAKRAGVMRLTWPETSPVPSGDPACRLRPLLYSLDVFLPFVNLHQEHYWWPDSQASGLWAISGMRLAVSGSLIEYYLWFQIIAGWLLSAIFVAGVTGLIRGD